MINFIQTNYIFLGALCLLLLLCAGRMVVYLILLAIIAYAAFYLRIWEYDTKLIMLFVGLCGVIWAIIESMSYPHTGQQKDMARYFERN